MSPLPYYPEPDLVPGVQRVFRAWHLSRESYALFPGAAGYGLEPIVHKLGKPIWHKGWCEAECKRDANDRSDPHVCRYGRSGYYASTRDHIDVSVIELMNIIPGAACSCGFYGRYTYTGVLEYMQGSVTSDVVFGVADVAGKVLLGSEGVRAQKAHIRALFYPGSKSVQKNLEKGFEVPVFDEMRKMVQKFPANPPKELLEPSNHPIQSGRDGGSFGHVYKPNTLKPE